jgi:predicted ferric reductase
MALCFLFAMRELNPVLSRLTHGCYFQRLPLHRLFGWLSLLWLAIHSALLAAFLWMKGTSGFDQLLHRLIPFGKSIRSEEAWVNLAGMIGLIALIGTGLLSLEWVRRNRYRLFLFTHIALTSTLVLMSFIHAWQSVVYVLPALALLIVDRAIPKVSGARFGNTAKVLSVRCNLVTLELRSPDGKSALPRYQPGSYLRLNVPVISRFDWHPFSIGSLWTDDSSRLLLFIKACGGFSRELLRLASNTPTGRIEINARGYFRNDSHTASYAKVLSGKDVFIAGGTGIVSFMPQLVYYYRQPPVVSTAPWLFWSVRHLKDLDIYPAEFISTIIRSERVKIFVTTPEDEETDQSEIVLAGNRGIYEKISDEGIDSNFESDHPPAASASPVNRSTALIFLTLIFSMGSYLLGRSIHLQLTPDDCRAEETNVSQFSGCILFYSLIPSLLILFTVFVLTLLFMWTLQYSHEKHEDVDDREQLLKYHRSVDAHVDLSLIKVYRGRIDVANELSTV